MAIKHKSFPLQVKEVSDKGEFSGYLSVFGNVDSYREIVMPGAFAESLAEWKQKNRLPPILWQHNSERPIGPFTKMEEDERGLYVEGRLLVDDVKDAKEAYALLKNQVIGGMSIGFRTVGQEWDEDERVRRLTKLDLWEGSIVTFPANEEAQVEAIKTALNGGELPTLKDFEKFLREAGFSKTQATAIASHGLSHLHRSESGTQANELADVLQAIKSNPCKGVTQE